MTGADRRTVLFGKYDIVEAAHVGTQRLRAKRVIPVALFAFQLDQWVLVSDELPSAHEITKLLGRDTAVSVQVRIFTAVSFDVEAPELAGMARVGTASAAASAMGEVMRARRDMMTAFFVFDWMLGEVSKVR